MNGYEPDLPLTVHEIYDIRMVFDCNNKIIDLNDYKDYIVDILNKHKWID